MSKILAWGLGVTLTLGACGHTPKVSVTGVMLITGGPLPVNGQPGPRPLVDISVHVLGKGTAETLKTESSGIFHTMLRPGRYTVVLGTPGNNPGVVQPRPDQINVTAREPNRFELIVNAI